MRFRFRYISPRKTHGSVIGQFTRYCKEIARVIKRLKTEQEWRDSKERRN